MQNDTLRIFPNLLRAMSASGLSKPELAARLGISRRTLDRRLNGSIEFRWNELRELHRIFPDISMHDLLNRTQPIFICHQ